IVFGRAYRETEFLAEAIEEFKKAVALDPKFPRGHYYLGLTYLLKHRGSRLGDAAEKLNIDLIANPGASFAHYHISIRCLLARNWAVTTGLLDKALGIQPDNPAPCGDLGEA